MNRPLLLLLVVLAWTTSGCDNRDQRLAQFAAESTRQQADQNREMARLNRDVAQAHDGLIGLQYQLGAQQAEINRGRDQLESERRDIAGQRFRDPIIAAAISNVGLILACLAPLSLAGYLLYCMRHQDDGQVVSEILIEDLASAHPMLLPNAQSTTAGPEQLPEVPLDRIAGH